jgi:hypothetical protein
MSISILFGVLCGFRITHISKAIKLQFLNILYANLPSMQNAADQHLS